jgi:hypothetical protein
MRRPGSLFNRQYGLWSVILFITLLLPIATVMASIQSPDGSHAASQTPLMLEDKHAEDVTTLDMSSGSASVELGPVVVNEDGASSARCGERC